MRFLRFLINSNYEEGRDSVWIRFIHAAPPLNQRVAIGETKLSLSQQLGGKDEWEGWLPLGKFEREEEPQDLSRSRSKSKPEPKKTAKRKGKEEDKEERRKTMANVSSEKKSKNRYNSQSDFNVDPEKAPMIHVKISKLALPPLVDNCFIFDSPEILDEIQTGDCVVFYGRSPLATVIVNTTKYPYSHVAIAIRRNGELQLVESTMNANDMKDALTKEVRTGVTIVDLKERLKNINAYAAWHVPLREPLSKSEGDQLIEKALELHKKEVKYDILQLFPFLFGIENREDFDKLFCSEMAAKVFREIGRLPPETNPSGVTPEMFVNSECFQSLGPDIRLRILRQQPKG